ncbi:NAD-dependent epimerase/dehydratase family protein [Filimonas effusa]|uniref:NAD-dependent epimerase/dehydratase family protein n=1 Tax=Filimonas effusa TaxID=2508721 RepID=A0A4Q1D1T4_9BACT|nr:NAD-dependent epimerase/dehydratase family protein [Filimonas effusa]RXK81838.1 NAD-dependent epimerase/dehydratase family protein [Filimonas effusa]
MKITITGSSGFIGRNLSSYLEENLNVEIVKIGRPQIYDGSYVDLLGDVVIHLAGKAHDVKNSSAEDEYYKANFELTRQLYDVFLKSDSRIFIFVSSVKAVRDNCTESLTEDIIPSPQSPYGKSKLMAEEYIMANKPPEGKSYFILRPCMVHGPGNKGNMNLLYSFVNKGVPWVFGAFQNKRSFCSVENFCFVINELVQRNDIYSGIYNIADDTPLSTNELISLIANASHKRIHIYKVSKRFIKAIFKLGDILGLPINTDKLDKMTSSYIVENSKLIKALGKGLPVGAKEGLIRTFQSFRNKDKFI